MDATERFTRSLSRFEAATLAWVERCPTGLGGVPPPTRRRAGTSVFISANSEAFADSAASPPAVGNRRSTITPLPPQAPGATHAASGRPGPGWNKGRVPRGASPLGSLSCDPACATASRPEGCPNGLGVPLRLGALKPGHLIVERERSDVASRQGPAGCVAIQSPVVATLLSLPAASSGFSPCVDSPTMVVSVRQLRLRRGRGRRGSSLISARRDFSVP